MAYQDIPREQWGSFFDEISREQQSGLITVEVRGSDIPQQNALTQATLLGISYEEKGSGSGRIDIMVGADTDTNASHTISSPAAVRAENVVTGGISTVQIDVAEGEPTTIIHFLSNI